MRHLNQHVATLATYSAPWVPIVVGVGLFLHKHFIGDGRADPADARVKAVARCRHAPKLQRRVRRKPSPDVDGTQQQKIIINPEQQLADAVLGNDTVYEWFNEDEVEALQQAQAQSNPQALLDLLQQYGSRMAAEGLLDQDDASEADSLWYTDDFEHTWQHDSPSSDRHHHQQQDSLQPQQQQDSLQPQQQQDPADAQQQEQPEASQEFLRRLAAAVQQQQQQQGTQGSRAASEASEADAAGAYFDDSYFGLPADPSADPQDLQELQAAVTKNLEALLPKDTTWAGSYPPRFDEVLSPAGDEGDYVGPAPEFDFEDPGFDYVPDFVYDPDFDPDFDDDMLDMFDFDIEP